MAERMLTVGPAYNRDYKSRDAAVAAWNEGRDFHSLGLSENGYINKDEAKDHGFTHVKIRYHALTKFVIVEL